MLDLLPHPFLSSQKDSPIGAVPRKKIIQENQGNELTRSNSPSPILGQEDEIREAEEEEQNKGWTPYTKTCYKKRAGSSKLGM
jgi:hypothetical protein